VEIVTKDDDKTIHTARGSNQENMARSIVDLRKFAGREIFIRIVDEETPGWGHVNFDDFVFHSEEPKFPANAVAQVAKAPPGPVDEIKFAGLTPEQAVKEMTLPPGFSAKVFAAEPDVTQPIAFCMDDRARLWVVEGHTYPKRAPEGEGRDRIIVFEDTDGDGRHDRRTVFMEGLNLVSGIEYGFGGLFVGAAPQFLFIPIADGDAPKPAGKPEVLLDGWGYQDTHETLNTFTWGPDGWLYGCHGVFTHSQVGKPGTPDEQRVKINAGVWRWQPVRREFEVFAHGTSNPWGIDFDARGQCFVEACVIPHLFHMIQGGRYDRQAGPHFDPYTFDDIKTIADHRHFVGGNPHAGNGRSDAAGGGHAHAGLLIYQGDSWPQQFRGKMFMNNIHGARINMDIPERTGSGFIGKHGADFINFNDRASQILNMISDQDGSMFMIDWYDKNQCHNVNPAAHDRTNGRIFKVVFENRKTTPVDMAKLSDEDLAWLQTHDNDWFARHARRLLQERTSKSPLKTEAVTVLVNLVRAASGSVINMIVYGKTEEEARMRGSGLGNPTVALRALWTLNACGALDNATVAKLLVLTGSVADSSREDLRAWTIQLACEQRAPGEVTLKEFARLAREDKSPVVRLYLASACQRLTLKQRQPIVEALLAHAEDASDQNLPLMYWYATEPLVASDPVLAATLIESTKIPKVAEFIARRLAATAKAAR
jgi:putative membrane-bound dehydrogenase-like protein